MHRIKRQAKRNAWYTDDGSRNLNPFGKLWREGPRGGPEDDLEAGPHRARTEDEGIMSSAEDRRISQWEDGENIHHAQTLPARPAGQRASQQSERGEGSETKSPESREAPPGLSDSTGAAAASEKKSTEEANGGSELRQRDHKKRKMGGLLGKVGLGHKKEDDESEEEEKEKKPKQKFTIWSQFQHTIFNSPINILLLLVPVGIAVAATDSVSAGAVFTINFIAIIPLAGLLSFATEEIALRTGETLGGLLNATFGNAVELIVSIIALFQRQYVIVQTSLVGSMLSNLLLVMGMCFFFGGLNKVEQHFNVTVAQTAASLLALAIGSLIIPTVYNQIVPLGRNGDTNENDGTLTSIDKQTRISEMSHGTSLLLLLVYGCYLYFQLSTHAAMYNEPSKKAERRKPKKAEKGDAIRSMIKSGAVGAQAGAQEDQRQSVSHKNEDDEEEVPKLSVTTAVITLIGSTVLVAFNAEFMTASIKKITESGALSPEFVGLILLPIVGNAAEHATAVTVSVKDKMDLAIGVAVGSSMQIALLVLPLVITIGWIADRPLTLAFDGFQVIVLFVAVLLVNYLIGDGKSHWLEGVLLQVLYIIIAIAAWFYPVAGEVAG